MELTVEDVMQYAGCTRVRAEKYLMYINWHGPRYGLTTPARMQAFLAQVSHETDSFSKMHERMHYSADNLRKFSYFRGWTDEQLSPYVGKPQALKEKLAEVYPNQYGTGVGAGFLHTTGRGNLTALQSELKSLGYVDENGNEVNVASDSSLLTTNDELAVISGMFFWSRARSRTSGKTLNELADEYDKELPGHIDNQVNRAITDEISRTINRYDPNLTNRAFRVSQSQTFRERREGIRYQIEQLAEQLDMAAHLRRWEQAGSEIDNATKPMPTSD